VIEELVKKYSLPFNLSAAEAVTLSAGNSQCLDNCINKVICRIFSVTSSDDEWNVGDVFGLLSVRVMAENKRK